MRYADLFENYYKVFHGPSKGRDFDVSQFRVPAFFTDNYEYAKKYVDDGEPLIFVIKINNPYFMDANEHELGADCEELAYDPDFRDDLIEQGYDGIIVKDNDIIDYVVFDANQIKASGEKS